MALGTKVSKFFAASYFEKKYFIGTLLAKLITSIFYRRLFGSIGSGSWIKSPRQVVSPRNISIGSDVRIESGAVLYSVGAYAKGTHDGKIRIGNQVYINHSCNLSCANEITIGDNVAFGPNVFICDFDHSYEDVMLGMIESPLVSKGPVTIGARSWIGANVYVASGVCLGEHCTVAANSVVTKSFPANSVIAGIPARVVKQYDAVTKQWNAPTAR